MVVIRCSFTTLVNEDVDPKVLGHVALTLDEFWSVLVAKSRNPLDYESEFSSCKIVREKRDAEGHLVELTRRLRVKGFEQEFEEVVTFKRPMMVCDMILAKKPYMIKTLLVCHIAKHLCLDYIRQPGRRSRLIHHQHCVRRYSRPKQDLHDFHVRVQAS